RRVGFCAAFCRPKSGKEHQSQTAISTFCGKKVQNTRDIVTAFSLLLTPKSTKYPAGEDRGVQPTKKRQTTPVADCDQDFLRPNSIWKSPRQGAVPGPPFPQNQSLFSALEPDLRLLVWWSREKSLPLKVICSNR
ncbi:hypothetical protein, partial [Alistipes shahii]|uniref:hypothetical protein n=2 Tax=Alistipes TaxID=239759 RepID=UPI0025995263